MGSIKGKVDQSYLINIRNFSFAKDHVKKLQRKAVGWENIFANHISGKKKKDTSGIYKELSKINSERDK